MNETWRPEPTDAVLRPRRRGRLVEPLRERRFTYDAYAAFLERIASDPRLRAVPLREFRDAARDRVIIGLRHDVDDRLDSALRLARLEQERGIRATYFVLHSAPYWERSDLTARLLELQDLGHEVGWHNDLVTLEVVHGINARTFLFTELERLRSAGIDIVGAAAHGSYWGHALGFSNQYFFRDLPSPVEGFPNTDQVVLAGEARVVPKGTLREFGLEYEAYHLGEDVYGSDSRFDARGRRWHPELLDLPALHPNRTAIALVHPCHWDTGMAAKYRRLLRRGIRFYARRPHASRNTAR